MFERFTHAARDAVIRARHEARELGQSPTGTQHVLLAMLTDHDGPIALALRDSGVDERYVRAEIVRRVGPRPPGHEAAGHEAAEAARAEADAEDAAALKAIGIDLDAVRRAIEENFGPGALRLPRDAPRRRRGLFGRRSGPGHTPFSPRAKKVLELSLREALRLKHNFIAPEHILLGLLREGSGLGVQILVEAGVDLDRLRADATRALQQQAA